jgi:hypothetical protein
MRNRPYTGPHPNSPTSSGRRVMRIAGPAIIGLCLGIPAIDLCIAGESEPEQKAKIPLEPLSRLIGGKWTVKGTWENGHELNAWATSEWGVNKHMVKTTTYAVNDGESELIYETVYAWHPGKKKIIFMSFSAWGAVYDGIVEPDGDELKYTWTAYAGDKVTQYRQTVRFLDNDRYTWTAFEKTDEGWTKLIDIIYRRN